MRSGEQVGRVIWTREIDWELQSERRRRFLYWYVAPAAVAVMAALIVGGFGAMLGVLILTGMFGLLLGAYVELRNRSRRMHPEIRVDDGYLVLAGGKSEQRVPIANVQRFTTYMTALQSSTYAGGTTVDSTVGAAAAEFLVKLDEIRETRFTRTSHEHVRFVWPLMGSRELQAVRAAIEPELPVAWLDVEDFRKPVPDGVGAPQAP